MRFNRFIALVLSSLLVGGTLPQEVRSHTVRVSLDSPIRTEALIPRVRWFIHVVNDRAERLKELFDQTMPPMNGGLQPAYVTGLPQTQPSSTGLMDRLTQFIESLIPTNRGGDVQGAYERWKREYHEAIQEHLTAVAHVQQSPQTDDHFAELKSDIRNAINLAPAGKTAVILGAGRLSDIPDEVFTSNKFTRIILIELESGLTRRALKERGFDQDPRIEVIEADLSMMNPTFIWEVEQIANQSNDLNDAKKKLLLLYNRVERGELDATRLGGLPIELGSAGLVISSTLDPFMNTFAVISLERVFAKKFGRTPPNDPSNAIFGNQMDYLRALSPVRSKLFDAHAKLLSSLSAENGVIYLAFLIAKANVRGISNEIRNQIETGFTQLAQVFSGLIPSMSKPLGRWVLGLFQTFGQNPMHAVIQWNFTRILLNYLDPKNPSTWTAGNTVLATRAWLWNDRPDLHKGEIVQTLTMRRSSSHTHRADWVATVLAILILNPEAFVRWAPVLLVIGYAIPFVVTMSLARSSGAQPFSMRYPKLTSTVVRSTPELFDERLSVEERQAAIDAFEAVITDFLSLDEQVLRRVGSNDYYRQIIQGHYIDGKDLKTVLPDMAPANRHRHHKEFRATLHTTLLYQILLVKKDDTAFIGSMPLKALNISESTVNLMSGTSLYRLRTIADLLDISEDMLWRIDRFSRTKSAPVKERLATLGLRLKPDVYQGRLPTPVTPPQRQTSQAA